MAILQKNDRIAAPQAVGKTCADCGGDLYCGSGPRDGWQLEDGREVCHACCVVDLQSIAARLTGRIQ